MTLGAHEVNDLGVAVEYLRGRFPNSTIGLWGRSMGAVTALLYSQKDPSIAGIVGPSASHFLCVFCCIWSLHSMLMCNAMPGMLLRASSSVGTGRDGIVELCIEQTTAHPVTTFTLTAKRSRQQPRCPTDL